MNRYFLIRRLKGPLILLLLGVVALLHHAGVVHMWSLFVPLLLILLGVLMLAERATLATMGDDPYAGGYPGATPGGYPGMYPGMYPGAYPGVYPGATAGVQPGGTPPTGTGTAAATGADGDTGEWKPPQGGQS